MAEFDDKLNSILSDPEAMAKIAQLAQSLSGGDGPAPPPPPEGSGQRPPGAAAPPPAAPRRASARGTRPARSCKEVFWNTVRALAYSRLHRDRPFRGPDAPPGRRKGPSPLLYVRLRDVSTDIL